jgi:hypothetical protein
MADNTSFHGQPGSRWIFRCGLHFMQIIRQGNNREENREKAGQRDNALRSTGAARRPRPANCEAAEKKNVTRRGDDGPHKVECEFHDQQLIRTASYENMLDSPTAAGYIGKSIPKEHKQSIK